MTVYEWLTSKDDIIVNFDKTINVDYKILRIQMNLLGCDHFIKINSDHTLTCLPITIVRTFYGEQIPNNDAAILNILDQMYQDLIAVFNNINYKNE